MKQTSAIMACQVETMPSPDQCGQGFRSTQEKKSPFQNGLVSDKLCAAICCFVIPTTVNMYLDESDQITYLANIIFLAHADGTLSPKVAAALEEVRASVGVTKHIYNLAEKCALSGVYSPTKAGDYAAQVSNMADMLYVAFVDAHISDAEKKLIAEFSRSLNLTEEQTAILTKDAINRLKKKELSLLCPSCKAPITSDSTYCPKCGALLVGNAAASEFSVPPSDYSIEFCDSAAANFRAALKIAQKAPTFLTCVRKKKNWYLASWPASSIGEAAHLAEALSGIRNKKCYRDGLEI
jgi:Zn finger protein HypA/HybF involved in hydrogenase expression